MYPVVAVPSNGVNILGDETQIASGPSFNVTCVSNPSNPPANLKFVISKDNKDSIVSFQDDDNDEVSDLVQAKDNWSEFVLAERGWVSVASVRVTSPAASTSISVVCLGENGMDKPMEDFVEIFTQCECRLRPS